MKGIFQMHLSNVLPEKDTDGGYRFIATLLTEERVEVHVTVDASHLFDYRSFQTAVLQQTGCLYSVGYVDDDVAYQDYWVKDVLGTFLQKVPHDVERTNTVG